VVWWEVGKHQGEKPKCENLVVEKGKSGKNYRAKEGLGGGAGIPPASGTGEE